MSIQSEMMDSGVYWFVGADQSKRLIREGIWEQRNPPDRDIALVKSMACGDRIAIKAAFVRKKEGIPFDNRGHAVSVMKIKATGRVKSNPGDGLMVEVEWDPRDETEAPREWFFYTFRGFVWRVQRNDWYSEGLIDFVFNGVPQDLVRFRNDPYWKERFGDRAGGNKNYAFAWTTFYVEMADKLMGFRNRRPELLERIRGITAKIEEYSPPGDKFEDGSQSPLDDICPFGVFALFNIAVKEERRKAIAEGLALLLEVKEPVPVSLSGIPVLSPMRSWFSYYEKNRRPHDIDDLWDVFEKAIGYADSEEAGEEEFTAAYDRALDVEGAAWNLPTGLHWIRPWEFLSLDGRSRNYLKNKLAIDIGQASRKGVPSGREYLSTLAKIKTLFQGENYPVHSFPDLSYAALLYKEHVASEDEMGENLLLEQIEKLCSRKGTMNFTREELYSYSRDALQERFPETDLLPRTVSVLLKALQNREKIEFLEQEGHYRLLSPVSFDGVSDPPQPQFPPYTLHSILEDGCFLEMKELEAILKQWRIKMNIILQGAPGTGKTWLAKKLAFALIGEKDENRVRSVQFHPNLFYEDFIRGYRPSGEGKLSLIDGPFLEVVSEALEEPEGKFVLVIEEINRGNPAQIFGEMLTLLEADKRTPSEAIELSYRKKGGKRIHIPANVYVIGTMNIADRSLALVDFALRRRFAFINLEPKFGEPWKKWLKEKWDFPPEFLEIIQRKIMTLNDLIALDSSLGKQFRIGHSYLIPSTQAPVTNPVEWFENVVRTEIGPQLEEYWFNDPNKAADAREKLLAGL